MLIGSITTTFQEFHSGDHVFLSAPEVYGVGYKQWTDLVNGSTQGLASSKSKYAQVVPIPSIPIQTHTYNYIRIITYIYIYTYSTHTYTYIHIHTHTYIYMYIYIYIHVPGYNPTGSIWKPSKIVPPKLHAALLFIILHFNSPKSQGEAQPCL